MIKSLKSLLTFFNLVQNASFLKNFAQTGAFAKGLIAVDKAACGPFINEVVNE